jgi:hypothetical protein
MNKFQSQVNNQLKTGDEEKDYRKGWINIRAEILRQLKEAGSSVTQNSVSAIEPHTNRPPPSKMTFSVSINGKSDSFNATKEQVIDSYERVADPVLVREIRALVGRLTT